jgi:CHAD domain-containing protein
MRTTNISFHEESVRVLDEEPGKDIAREFAPVWEHYRKASKRCRDKLSPKSLHRLRLALRRLVVVLEFCQADGPSQETAECVRSLKNQIKKFGALRDIHTQLAHVKKFQRTRPCLRRYKKALQVERKTGRRKLARFLCGQKDNKVKALVFRVWSSWVSKSGKRIVTGNAVRGLARRRLRVLMSEVLQRIEAAKSGELESLHRLRVAIKRLRYTWEFLKPVIDGMDEQAVRQLMAWQVQLGRVQDLRIFFASLKEWLKAQPKPVKEQFKEPCRELERRLTSRAVYLADKMSSTPLRPVRISHARLSETTAPMR